jgi:hypothetical protein
MRRNVRTIVFLFAAVGIGRSQSIDPRQPAPLKAGLNGSMVDSTVGAQYWYFMGEPGHVDVVARWVRGQFDVGQPVPLDIAVFDEGRTWIYRRQITPEKETSETHISLTFKQPAKTIVSVTAPRGGLVRQGGDYELIVSGAAQFPVAGAAKAESIARTYSNGDFGAVRFDANGTLETEDGTRGTWRLFDAERRVYVVMIGNRRFSVKLMPGQGLVDPANPSSITFREVH